MPLTLGYRKQGPSKLILIRRGETRADLPFGTKYMIGYDTVMMTLPSDVLDQFLFYLQDSLVGALPTSGHARR